jgi:transcriptional regulator GlxA family with amidase domain
MTKTVGIVVYPGVEELDFVGPLEVFGGMAAIDREWQVVTIAETPTVRAYHGLKTTVDHTFEDAPPLDVILVPGGLGSREQMTNAPLLDFVREAGKGATYVTSVCTGALILHAAGFLPGRRATTHWGAIELLRGLGDVEVVSERFVQDGNVITSAGVSAGIDMALYVVSLLKDPATAANVQKMMEYYPQPPVFAEAPA